MALRSTARRFGFEVSWLIRLTRQETSPFGPCLTLRLHWQLVIRHSSGHAISLSCLTAGLYGKVMTLVACVFIWGSSRLSCIPNPTISAFFYNNGEGPLQALLKPSLSIFHIMVSGDTCPQGSSFYTPVSVSTARHRYRRGRHTGRARILLTQLHHSRREGLNSGSQTVGCGPFIPAPASRFRADSLLEPQLALLQAAGVRGLLRCVQELPHDLPSAGA
jgi:hypothetical protein